MSRENTLHTHVPAVLDNTAHAAKPGRSSAKTGKSVESARSSAVLGVEVAIPAEVVEVIARRAAELVLEQVGSDAARVSEYLTVPEAAEFLRCRRQRVDDLLSQRRLTRFKDGSRTLLSRAELLRHVAGELPPLAPTRMRRAVAR